MIEIAWPITVAVVSAFALIGWSLHLRRDQRSIADIKRELDAMAAGWNGRFDHTEARVDRMERAIVNVEPKFTPLGKQYSTRQQS